MVASRRNATGDNGAGGVAVAADVGTVDLIEAGSEASSEATVVRNSGIRVRPRVFRGLRALLPAISRSFYPGNQFPSIGGIRRSRQWRLRHRVRSLQAEASR